MMVAGYSMVAMTTIWGTQPLAGRPPRLRADDPAGAVPRRTNAATPGRLPGDRHHRGGGDHPPDDQRREVLRDFGGQDGVPASSDRSVTGPFSGTVGIPGVVSWGAYDFWVMTVGWGLVAICCLIAWALMRSPWGRVLKSIREDEDAVRSLGKNVYAYKMQSLIIGGMFGGLAGMRRPEVGHGRPLVLRHRRDVLRLHRPADRWRSASLRPRGRVGDLLLPDHRARPVLRPGHRRLPTRSSRRRS